MTHIDYALHRRRATVLRRRAIRVFIRRAALALRGVWANAAQASGSAAARRPVTT
jgi:hypothetical protein